MRGEEFKRIARQGVRGYGDDPWFFLRELAQNSRDAGARGIRVEARRDEASREVLVFEDDGRGMGRSHAERFLFRLYASSKETERRAAGRYGIGFWTVLAFEPDTLEVASRSGDDAWALRLDADFTVRSTPCPLVSDGTRVTLSRPAQAPDAETFRAAVREGLRRTCRYLRRNDRASTPLPVELDGERVAEPFRTGGPVEIRFRHGAVEGAVGLGESPRVELYARGLPVWQGLFLEELSHVPPATVAPAGLENGLSPVFVLNGNDLDVVMDRTAVVDDAALRRLKRRARAALRRLVRAQLVGLQDRGPLPGLRTLLGRLRRAGPGLPLAALAALGIIVLAVPQLRPSPPGGSGGIRTETASPAPSAPPDRSAPFVAGAGRPASQPRPAATDLPALLDALETYDGAVVEDSPGGDVLELSWSPRGTAWFRVSVAEEVDPDRGFLRVARPDASLPLAELPAGGDRLRVRLRGPGGPGLSVPVPTGWSVSPDSLAWNGRSLSRGEARTGQGGEVLASLPAEPGVLEYTCGPRPQSLSPEETLRLLRTPPLPEPLEAELRPLELLPPEERVAGALARIRSRMAYSADPGEPVGPADAGWAARVLARGRGDCDVLNGLLALALRRLGVPARLAIGFTGEDGRLRPGLHAWTEFHVGTWQAVDASASALEQPLVTPPPRPAGVRPVPPFPRPLLRPPPGIPSPVDAGPAAAAALAPDIRPEQPVPTAPPGMAPAAPQDRSPERPWLLLAALAAALLGLGLLFVGIRRRAGFHLDGGEASGDREAVLGRMALSWSVRPDLWGTPGFSAAPILPRIRGGRVSLDAALRIARRRRLLLASPGNPLARGCRRSAALLDLSNPGFAAFLRRIPGALDLDAVQDAHPRPPVEGDGPVNALLAAANRLLDALGETRAPCLLAEGLSAEGLGDVDLGALADTGGLPRTFLAADPTSPQLRHLASLHSEAPALALHRFISWLSLRSGLLRRSPAQLRRRAARHLLGGAP